MSVPPAASRSAQSLPGLNLLYVVAVWVPRRETIVVGSLGPVTFARGWHAYVGSARRGRDARVARHMRTDKPLRWHADYLFARHPAARVWLLDTPLTECELAARLRAASTSGPDDAPRGPVATSAAAVADAPPVADAAPVADAVPVADAALRFGSSDCRCPGHLLRISRRGALEAALNAIAGPGGRPRTEPSTEQQGEGS